MLQMLQYTRTLIKRSLARERREYWKQSGPWRAKRRNAFDL